MKSERLLVISPVYNEAANIERVVRSVAAQRRAPDRWIIADDGSTDGTLEILRALEPEVPFMEVLERPATTDDDLSDRLAVALEAVAFNRALATVEDASTYTHIAKLDGDVELPVEWFDVLLERFAEDPKLGLAGGALVEGEECRRLPIPDHHVHGAVKLFSRECFEACGGIQPRLGWDTIDETYARMRGFKTRTFGDLVGGHLRPAASADGQLRGRARHGECAWILHYPLAWVAARSFKMALERPRGLSGLWFLWGYARSVVRRVPQVEDEQFRRFVRRELGARVLATVRPPAEEPAT